MTRPLRHLNGLRAFEAAARHLSFKKAARELSVTPAAVGHQVKLLEDFLGVRLFHRLNRALLLTDAGLAALPDLQEGLDKLAAAVEAARAGGPRAVLTVTVAPSLAAKWLIPRLQRFRAAWSDISVRIDTALEELDLVQEAVDLAIRFGAGRYPGLHVERLMGERLLPVCSPALLRGADPLERPEDLRRLTLLHIEGETRDAAWPGWVAWLNAAQCSAVDGTAGPRFSQTLMAVQAAVAGQGVALAPLSAVLDDLADGRLLRLFPEVPASPTGFAWYLVSPPSLAESPKVTAFRDWVTAEVAAEGAFAAPD